MSEDGLVVPGYPSGHTNLFLLDKVEGIFIKKQLFLRYYGIHVVFNTTKETVNKNYSIHKLIPA